MRKKQNVRYVRNEESIQKFVRRTNGSEKVIRASKKKPIKDAAPRRGRVCKARRNLLSLDSSK